MQEWYRAVCDKHKVYCDVFIAINTWRIVPAHFGHPVDPGEMVAGGFLSDHWDCTLRLVHRDDELDELHDGDYVDEFKEPFGNEDETKKE
jgi:hypothetical protein